MGRSESGKTSLTQALKGEELHYHKTQYTNTAEDTIDTPGEYLENRHFYNALIMTAVDAGIIALVADPTSEYRAIPPGFAGIFGKKVIGVVTKIKQAGGEQIKKAERQLKEAGVSRIFLVDTPDGTGIGELSEFLNRERGAK